MPNRIALIKALVFTLGLLPLAWLVYAVVFDLLGANPIEALTRSLGDWALRFLLLTLSITPLRRLTGINWLIRLRRMVGLFAFFYALLHLCSYIILDQFFYWPEIWADIIKRPYITIGMACFILLIPLAITSTNAMIRRLGKNWARLHKLIYLIATGAVLHYLMLVRVLTPEPILYAGLLGMLLTARLMPYRPK